MSTPPRRPRQPSSTMRTSYHVGRPWMFDGKMLRAATGTPMRRTARANRLFADAEPEPLTFANLTTKSLTLAIGCILGDLLGFAPGRPKRRRHPPRGEANEVSLGVHQSAATPSVARSAALPAARCDAQRSFACATSS